MKPESFPRWKRRYLRLLHKQWMLLHQSRREGKPKQVHELRVTLRDWTDGSSGAPLLDETAVDDYRRLVRVISTATSRLPRL